MLCYAKLSVQANPSSLRSFWQLQVRFRCDDQQKDVTENNNSGSSRGFSRWERRFHSSLVVMNSVGLLLFLFLAAPVQVSAKALTFSSLNPKLFLSLFQHVMESWLYIQHGVLVHRSNQLCWRQQSIRLMYFSDTSLARDASCCASVRTQRIRHTGRWPEDSNYDAVRITLTLHLHEQQHSIKQMQQVSRNIISFLIPFLKMTNYSHYLVMFRKEVSLTQQVDYPVL